MNIHRDPETVIAAWLDDGPTELPETTRRAIATAARTMPQRRSGLAGPWRYRSMNGFVKLAVATAAVLIAAVGGLVLLSPTPFTGPGGQPVATATPVPTPSPTPTPRPTFNSIGTLTLTATGCSFERSSSPPSGRFITITLVNQWSDEGDFGLHRISDGHTVAEIRAGIADLNAKLAENKPASVYGIAFMTQETAFHGVPAGGTTAMSAIVTPGTHVVLCARVVDGRQVEAYVAGDALVID